MSETMITGIVAIVSAAVGFLGSFFLLRKQLDENRKERIRDRKIATAKQAIDSACELLDAVSELSDINAEIKLITENKANIKTISQYSDHFLKLKQEQPEIIAAWDKYGTKLAKTWKAYAIIRMSLSEELGKDYIAFTDYLNSLILGDTRVEWDEMLNNANKLIDKVKGEVEKY